MTDRSSWHRPATQTSDQSRLKRAKATAASLNLALTERLTIHFLDRCARDRLTILKDAFHREGRTIVVMLTGTRKRRARTRRETARPPEIARDRTFISFYFQTRKLLACLPPLRGVWRHSQHIAAMDDRYAMRRDMRMHAPRVDIAVFDYLKKRFIFGG